MHVTQRACGLRHRRNVIPWLYIYVGWKMIGMVELSYCSGRRIGAALMLSLAQPAYLLATPAAASWLHLLVNSTYMHP